MGVVTVLKAAVPSTIFPSAGARESCRPGPLARAGQCVPRAGAPFAETARGRAYLVASARQSAAGSDICFAAQDVKSVLRTKAALCAAADSLLAAVGLPREHPPPKGGR